MRIQEAVKEIAKIAQDKGFWDNERNTGELLMLTTSELGEALEADRAGRYAEASHTDFEDLYDLSDDEFKAIFEKNIKDTFEDEIADAVIRLFDLSAYKGIEITEHIRAKMRYNSLRPRLHGKRY